MTDNRYVLSDEELAELANKVFDGSRVLDQLYPGWFWKIDFRELNMTSGFDCVLGQLYDTYPKGLKALHWTEETAEKMGVYIDDSDMPDNEWIAKYAELQECWIGEIADRLTDSLLDRL